jgi:hypothetical protein
MGRACAPPSGHRQACRRQTLGTPITNSRAESARAFCFSRRATACTPVAAVIQRRTRTHPGVWFSHVLIGSRSVRAFRPCLAPAAHERCASSHAPSEMLPAARPRQGEDLRARVHAPWASNCHRGDVPRMRMRRHRETRCCVGPHGWGCSSAPVPDGTSVGRRVSAGAAPPGSRRAPRRSAVRPSS